MHDWSKKLNGLLYFVAAVVFLFLFLLILPAILFATASVIILIIRSYDES